MQSNALSFYNRVGGGALGLATGALAVVAALTLFLMFAGARELAKDAWASRTLRYSRDLLQVLGDRVPEEVREVYKLEPATEPPATEPKDSEDKK